MKCDNLEKTKHLPNQPGGRKTTLNLNKHNI